LTVDCGRELYVAAELASGRTLYSDVRYPYTPSSPYVNSVLFQLFGFQLCVRRFQLHFVPSLSMRNACVFSFGQEPSVTREPAPATPASCKIRDVRPTRSSSMKIVGMFGVLLLSSSLACSGQSSREPVTVTFLDVERAGSDHLPGLEQDLLDVTSPTGIQVKRLPGPNGSLNRLAPWRELL